MIDECRGRNFVLTLTTPIPAGTSDDYNDLLNKPTINGVEIAGDLSLDALGVQPAGDYASEPLTAEEIDALIDSLM